MTTDEMPGWLESLEDEDINFIQKFILASGSLKELAQSYGVSYPTIRLRLDRLIQKIQIHDAEENGSYVDLIKKLAIDEKIDMDAAKVLISEYKKQQKESN